MRRKKVIIPIVIIFLVIVLWEARILPSGLSILTAKRYVDNKYSDRGFEYSFVEYSSIHEKYFVHFIDKNGYKLAIMTSPFSVWYDPLDPPG